MRRTVARLRREIAEATAMRAEALHPAFNCAPRLDDVAAAEEWLRDLRAEHDELDARGAR